MTEAEAQPHSVVEDIGGLATGIVMVSVGLYLLHSVQAVTGGTAGLSLLLSYATGWNYSLVYLLINVPFYVLAVQVKGWQFTIRSLIAVVGTAGLSAAQTSLLGISNSVAWYTILLGNLMVGVGLLVLFRHQSSVGGFGVVALIAQERLKWPAGYVQMGLDVAVVLAAFAVVSPLMVLLSALGAVLLNLVIALNHKPGRYTGF